MAATEPRAIHHRSGAVGLLVAVRITHLAGVVMVPRRNTLTLRQVEFLPLSE